MPARLNPRSFVWDWMIKVNAAYCSHRTFTWIKIHSSTPHVLGLDAKRSTIPHLMIDLNREEPAETTAVQSPCRRSGCGFSGDMARWHLSSWLVGCERWRGRGGGDVSPSWSVACLHSRARLRWLKMAAQLNPQPQALFGVSCHVRFLGRLLMVHLGKTSKHFLPCSPQQNAAQIKAERSDADKVIMHNRGLLDCFSSIWIT